MKTESQWSGVNSREYGEQRREAVSDEQSKVEREVKGRICRKKEGKAMRVEEEAFVRVKE